MKYRYEQFEFDKLQMYFAQPYVIDLENTQGLITVYEPTIGDIIECGEKKFFNTLGIFVDNTTTYRSLLWDAGQDWNTMSDFELFCSMYQGIDADVSKLMFGDLDWNKFELCSKQVSEDKAETVLFNSEKGIEINERVYQIFHQYLQAVFTLHPEEKITKVDTLKKWYIDKDKRELKNAELKRKKGEDKKHSMMNLISSCVNHPGFKYKTSELKQVHVYEFYDSVQRLQVYEHSTAVLKGMFSGFVDGKKIPADAYNFMKDVSKE